MDVLPIQMRAGERKRRERQPNWETKEIFALVRAKKAKHDEWKQEQLVLHGDLTRRCNWERSWGLSKMWAKVAEVVCRAGASSVIRSAEACKDKWGQLNREYKKIRDYEKGCAARGNQCPPYWQLPASERQEFHLPKTFHSRELYEMMDDGGQSLATPQQQEHVGDTEEVAEAEILDRLARLRERICERDARSQDTEPDTEPSSASEARSLEVEAVPTKDGSVTVLEGKQYESILAEFVADGTVGLIRLNRPKALNALSQALMLELVDALQTFDASTQVGAVVITGTGEVFSAGFDIQEMKDKSGLISTFGSCFAHHWNAFSAIRKPIIATMNGYALGGGAELAMMCDIILAGERAQFGQPEVNLGTIPGMGGSQRLIREVGKSRAMEMILTGKHFMNADEAAQRGLVSRVVRGGVESLVGEAVSLAREISEKSKPVVALAKDIVNSAYEMGLAEGLKKERLLCYATLGMEDQKEGMAAFLEKRSPVFQDK